MPLPILEAPKYEVVIPSTGKKVNYRPYLVKEEKLLLLAMESENQTQILQTMKDVVDNCTYNKLDVSKLTIFDIEFIFLKLRTKSVGEIAKIGVKCEKCGKPTEVSINLDAVNVSSVPKSNKIKLTDKIGVTMRYPTVGQLKPDQPERSKIEDAIEIVIDCIENIYDDKGIYPSEEQSKEEMNAFINSLNREQFAKIQEFVAKMPRLEQKIKFTCKATKLDGPQAGGVCGHENDLTLAGLQSFFG
jgi:hypothetical protein